jgi:hypothetical protein
VIPEDINKLFEGPDANSSEKTTPGELPFDPEPARKSPEDLPEPERKAPMGTPESEPGTDALPDLFNEGSAKPLPKSSPTAKPAPPANNTSPGKLPSLPDFERTPSLEDAPNLFPNPPKKPETKTEKDEKGPSLFDDSYIPPLRSELRITAAEATPSQSSSTIRFGRVIPASAEGEPTIRVQLTGGTVDLGGGIYGPGPAHAGPPQPLLRLK